MYKIIDFIVLDFANIVSNDFINSIDWNKVNSFTKGLNFRSDALEKGYNDKYKYYSKNYSLDKLKKIKQFLILIDNLKAESWFYKGMNDYKDGFIDYIFHFQHNIEKFLLKDKITMTVRRARNQFCTVTFHVDGFSSFSITFKNE